MRTPPFYVTGGTMPADAPSYVPRQADSLLYDALKDGVFAYVLTPRQQGKSSLMNQVARRLRDEGVAVAALDLSGIGFNLDEEHWYNGLLTQLGRRLKLEDEIDDYLRDHAGLSPLQSWQGVLRDVVLEQISGPVVLFLDEIDIVRSLPFSTDELFAAIRACYNARTEDTAYERLTFCLLGVATPSDLIQNPRLTPFNIGRRIDLADFTGEEARLLQFGLGKSEETNRRLMARIFWWTSGHPYLTQRLCQAVAQDEAALTDAQVDRICGSLFLSPEAGLRDDNLGYVQQRLLAPPIGPATMEDGEESRAALLTLYQRILGEKPVPDKETDELARTLKLSGAVRPENRRLAPRNRIYARVFDTRWVREHMPDAERRRQRAAYWKGVRRTALMAGALFGVISALTLFALLQWRKASRLQRELRDSAYVGSLYQGFRQFDDGFLQGAQNQLESTTPRLGEADQRGFEWRYLWGQLHPESRLLRGHTAGVFCQAVSPDGRLLATGGFDKTLCLWDVESGHLRWRFRNLDGEVTALTFSPDGRRLAAGMGLESIWMGIWDVRSGTRQHYQRLDPNLKRGRVINFAFSKEDDSILIGADDLNNPMRLWRWRPGSTLESLPMPTHFRFGDGVTFAQSPDGGLRVIAGADISHPDYAVPALFLQRQNESHWTRVATAPTHDDAFQCVSFSPDGLWLAVGGRHGLVYLWRAGDYTHAARILTAGTQAIHGVALSPDGRRVAAGSWDNLIYNWTLPDFREGPRLRGHTDLVNGVSFLPGNGVVRLSSISNDHTVRIWDKETMAHPADNYLFSEGGDRISRTEDGRILAFFFNATADRPIQLWQTDPPRRIVTAPLRGQAIALSPDGRLVIVQDKTERRRAVETETGRIVADLTQYGTIAYFSSDGKRLACLHKNQEVCLLSVPDFREVDRIPSLGVVSRIVFSPDARRLVWATREHINVLHVYDIARHQVTMKLKMPRNAPNDIAFSPDGRFLAAADWAGPIAVWEMRTGNKSAEFSGHVRGASKIAFSGDGLTMATQGYDGILKFWNVATWRETGRVRTGLADEYGLRFLPNDHGLVVANAKGMRLLRAPPFSEIAAGDAPAQTRPIALHNSFNDK